MADPLSIAASIVGISAAGFQVSSTLLKFAGDVGSAAKDARQMGTEISCLCTVLQVLGTTLEEADAISALRCGNLTERMTQSCCDIFDEISNLVEELRPHVSLPGETALRLAARVKWAFQKSRIVYLRASLESYKNTLNLTLSTLDLARRVAKRRASTSSVVDHASYSHQESRIQSLELAQRASIAELQELEEEASAFSMTGGTAGQRLSWAPERNSQWLQYEQRNLKRWSSHLMDAQSTDIINEAPEIRVDFRRSRRITRAFDGTIQAPPSQIIEELQESTNSSDFPLSWDPASFDEDKLRTIEDVRRWLDTLSAADQLKAWRGLLPTGYGIRCQDSPDPTATPFFSIHECPPSALSLPSLSRSSVPLIQVPRIPPEPSNDESQITGMAPQLPSNPEGDNPQVEIFKSFRVNIDDPCHKALPVALKKYGITADWRQYSLYIVHGDQERCLGLDERPLILFKQLDREGKKPMFVLRKHVPPTGGHSSTIKPGSTATYRSQGGQTMVPGGLI